MSPNAENIYCTLTFNTTLDGTLSVGQPELHTQGSRSCNWGWWRNPANLNDQSLNCGADISTLDKQPETKHKVYVNQSNSKKHMAISQ